MGLLGLLSPGKKAAKRQAKATLDAAEKVASSDREAIRGNTLAMSATIAQSRAADAAAELLSAPQEQASVILSPEQDTPEIDPATGRRRTIRSQFFTTGASSGINI